MASVVSVVIHPSRIFREGLTNMLAQSPFAPACAAASTKDVPNTISTAGEQVLVLIGVSEASVPILKFLFNFGVDGEGTTTEAVDRSEDIVG